MLDRNFFRQGRTNDPLLCLTIHNSFVDRLMQSAHNCRKKANVFSISVLHCFVTATVCKGYPNNHDFHAENGLQMSVNIEHKTEEGCDLSACTHE